MKEEVERYSRQILTPFLRISGHEKLASGSVLIIGSGGLGSPCALYLASSGIGKIGIVDYDVVELSNLHRQILHDETTIGMNKVESAKLRLSKMNSRCEIVIINEIFDSKNGPSLVKNFDVIVDASDNVMTRYIVNDCCVKLGKPLVSGSALGTMGQLSVYNLNKGPCYRCLYPTAPSSAFVKNCNEGGIIAPVTGIIGSLQAMEVIRILANKSSAYSGKLLVYDGDDGSFRTFKLRNRQPECLCKYGMLLNFESIDYESISQRGPNDKCQNIELLDQSLRISCQSFYNDFYSRDDTCIIDVRPSIQFEIFALENSINIPWDELSKDENNNELFEALQQKNVFVICRRGNNSQRAVLKLKEFGINSKDIIGGITEWAKKIDRSLPIL